MISVRVVKQIGYNEVMAEYARKQDRTAVVGIVNLLVSIVGLEEPNADVAIINRQRLDRIGGLTTVLWRDEWWTIEGNSRPSEEFELAVSLCPVEKGYDL
jgi:hypothetical protein